MGNTTFLLGGETPSFQDDLACVLELAEGELNRLRKDALLNNYFSSTDSFDRIKRFFEVVYPEE